MTYIAGDCKLQYPGVGDPVPKDVNAKVLLLTIGGVCIQGTWASAGKSVIAWAPLPKRDKAKEALLGI